MLATLIKSKLKATGIHLGLSFIIFLVLFAIILFWWYPGVWFTIDGGWQGTRIMLLVDMVLGPALTFLIFNPKKSKRAIVFDFSCIALAQAIALSWGIYSVHGQRPLAIVFMDGVFYSVDKQGLEKTGKTADDLAHLGDRFPVYAYVEAPKTEEEKKAFLDLLFTKGINPYEQVERLKPYHEHIDDIFDYAEQSFKINIHGTGDDAQAHIGFNGRYGIHVLVVNRQGEIVDSYPEKFDESGEVSSST